MITSISYPLCLSEKLTTSYDTTPLIFFQFTVDKPWNGVDHEIVTQLGVCKREGCPWCKRGSQISYHTYLHETRL